MGMAHLLNPLDKEREMEEKLRHCVPVAEIRTIWSLKTF
jgi:hypothetical protein